MAEPFAVLEGGDWMHPQPDLLGLLEPFSGTWPLSGSMRNGKLFERPMRALHIAGNVSSSSGTDRLLPTPTVDDEGNPYGRTSGQIPGLPTEVLTVIHGAVEKDLSNPLTRSV